MNKSREAMSERQPITKEKCIELARESWQKVPRNRGYAGTPEVNTVNGAIAQAWYEAGGSFANHQDADAETYDKFLAKLAETAPDMGMVQPTPGEPKVMPKLWTHPLTGAPLPPPKGPDERAILAKSDTELLDLLDQLEARPYATTKKLRDEEEKRLRASVIKYTEAEHKTNVFANGATESAKATFVREFPDLVETYKREAQPIQLPVGKNKSLTIAGQIGRRDPKLYAVISRADEILRVWHEQERERLRQEKERAERELKRLEA